MTVPVPLTDIEAAARESATPGPWQIDRVGYEGEVLGPDRRAIADVFVEGAGQAADYQLAYRTARHIAAADPPTVLALCEALRIAVEALHEVAVDHEPMPVNDGRDWCSKCQNYMRGDSGCTAADATSALAAVRELVDLGGDDG